MTESIKLLDLNNDWQQARPDLKICENSLTFNGYQKFSITDNNIAPLSENTILKFNIIKKHIYEDIKNNSILDLCCANAFFSYFSILNGANSVTGVDLDKGYLKLHKTIINHLLLNDIKIVEHQAAKYNKTHDVVFAFATIHWLYSASGFIGSLKGVIRHLTNLTGKILYVEWIDPTDDCITSFKHLSYNKNLTEKDYNKTNFISLLREDFKSVEFLGKSKSTREIYRCVI